MSDPDRSGPDRSDRLPFGAGTRQSPATTSPNWAAPDPASPDELRRHALPCDVQVGLTIFRKGTALLLLVEQHRALYGRLYEGKDYL